jgi:multimeric flavodoxin WrbA
MNSKGALLLIGSPRAKSNSASLGGYLCDQLNKHGWEIETLRARAAVASPEKTEQLREAVDRADLVVVAFPLYVDSLPAPLIRAFEEMARERSGREPTKRQRLVAIVNSGFPESSQSRTALDICRLFARETGFEWAGGLALGAGEMLGQKPLEEAGGVAQGIRTALETTATALAENRPVPREAVDQMAKPAIPGWLYVLAGNWGWRMQARKQNAHRRLRTRPYETHSA